MNFTRFCNTLSLKKSLQIKTFKFLFNNIRLVEAYAENLVHHVDYIVKTHNKNTFTRILHTLVKSYKLPTLDPLQYIYKNTFKPVLLHCSIRPLIAKVNYQESFQTNIDKS